MLTLHDRVTSLLRNAPTLRLFRSLLPHGRWRPTTTTMPLSQPCQSLTSGVPGSDHVHRRDRPFTPSRHTQTVGGQRHLPRMRAQSASPAHPIWTGDLQSRTPVKCHVQTAEKSERKRGDVRWMAGLRNCNWTFLGTLLQLCWHDNVRYALIGGSKLSAHAYPLLGANRLGRAGQRCSPDSEWSPYCRYVQILKSADY